ncbi:MAG: aminoacyl-tRNA hydrolase [Saprospiraceae bacterium]|nr:aminoacyl-tRNA hydrolase [Candidatus Brachybacter algidus]
MRIRPIGGDGGHNGLKHINETFGNHFYARMRVGIGTIFSRGRQVDYVLGKWDKERNASRASSNMRQAVFCFRYDRYNRSDE